GVCGNPQTKEIRVVECADCEVPVVCPTNIAVTATPELIQVNETTTFTATADLNGNSPTFNWTVSAGEIVSGQGTNAIVVRATEGLGGQSITATGTLGNIDPSCQNTASATVQVGETPVAKVVDEYGKLKPNDEKARLDTFAVELQNNPNARGLIIAYGTGRNPARNAQARIAFALRYLTQTRGIDAGRIDTVDGGASSAERTQLYVVPAGATAPTPTPTPTPQ
ncbi:MAG: PKD domain-containing protein, partial [Pyrinomonadaceae bacterium]|nr:PKD domain-containing protein [Pyrinomonadaceae bacterium]